MRATTMNEAPASQMLFCQLASGFAVLLPCAILFGQTHIGLTPLMLSSMGFQTFVVAFASYLSGVSSSSSIWRQGSGSSSS